MTSNTTSDPQVRPAGRACWLPTPVAFGAMPDLNAIAAQVRKAQAERSSNPAGREELVVDGNGQVAFALDADRSRPLTTLSQETFAVLGWPRQTRDTGRRPAPGWDREAYEARTVAERFPVGSRRVSDGRTSGWLYEIVNEFGDTYTFFAYFDPSAGLYRVALIEPQLRGTLGQHDAHLFTSGVVCLNERSGCEDLAQAFARSALWCRGASAVRRGHGFQFNLGQAR